PLPQEERGEQERPLAVAPATRLLRALEALGREDEPDVCPRDVGGRIRGLERNGSAEDDSAVPLDLLLKVETVGPGGGLLPEATSSMISRTLREMASCASRLMPSSARARASSMSPARR